MKAVCKRCGVPLIISKTHTWRDGCLVDNDGGNADFCVYEADFHNHLLARAGSELGISLDSIVLNAGRNASAKIVRDGLSSHPLVAKVISKAPFYHISEPILTYFGRSIGLGKIEVLYHRKGRRGALRFTAPYHQAHCAGALLGCMDVMYGYPVKYTVSEEGEGVLLCELIPGERDDTFGEEAFRRLATIDLVPAKTKYGSLPACGRCGAPRGVGDLFRFDLDTGIITGRESGERVVLLGLYSLNSILRELEKELGQDVNQIFIGMEKEGFKSKLESTPLSEDLREMKDIREYLALRGLGLLSEMREEGGKATFVVQNAFIAPLVAGRLLALCDHRYGGECAYEYTLQGNILRLDVRTA